jgi:hypothetical protein
MAMIVDVYPQNNGELTMDSKGFGKGFEATDNQYGTKVKVFRTNGNFAQTNRGTYHTDKLSRGGKSLFDHGLNKEGKSVEGISDADFDSGKTPDGGPMPEDNKSVKYKDKEGKEYTGKIVDDMGDRVRVELPDGDRQNILKSDLLPANKKHGKGIGPYSYEVESPTKHDMLRGGRRIATIEKVGDEWTSDTPEGKITGKTPDEVSDKIKVMMGDRPTSPPPQTEREKAAYKAEQNSPYMKMHREAKKNALGTRTGSRFDKSTKGEAGGFTKREKERMASITAEYMIGKHVNDRDRAITEISKITKSRADATRIFDNVIRGKK